MNLRVSTFKARYSYRYFNQLGDIPIDKFTAEKLLMYRYSFDLAELILVKIEDKSGRRLFI